VTAQLMAAARAKRDRRWGRRITYSPKVFLPVTNLCRNVCDYCAFRKSPKDEGAHTMAPSEIDQQLARARALGCVEALLCLGDRPEAGFPSYRRQLAAWGHSTTVSYLVEVSRRALALGLVPHTNAGVLTKDEMAELAPYNASLGLMLESVSERLCAKGMPHHRAPDKRPAVRLQMLEEAGELRIPFTTGILVGIGETEAERVEALVAIRDAHRRHGHVQEVIVQPFRPHAGTPMAGAPGCDDDVLARAIALARLILDEDVTVQAPPNLAPIELMLDAGINDLGGISPLTPDFINVTHAWPHIARLGGELAARGFELEPRLPVHAAFAHMAPPSVLAVAR
jgi:FO synthase